MSTLSGLLLRQPEFAPFDLGRTLTQATNIQGGQLQNQTRLLELADLKQKQAAEAEMMAAIQNNPALAQQLFGGGPVLGSLGPPTGSPPGAFTQTPLGGGPAQTIPAYPDASRYAGVSPQGGGPIPPNVAAQVMPTVTPAQSTIAALSPQPQAQPSPQDRLLQLARTNPRAALLLQQQMQQQQEQQFKMRATVAEGIAVELQGATDQASYDAARQRVAQISPQWAQALPQVYSKEAVQPWIDRALGAKDKATLDMQNMQTQVDLYKARVTAAGQQIVPKYTGDAQRDSLIHSEMQRQGLTGTPPQAVLDTVEQRIQQGKINVSALQGTGQIVKGPTGDYVRVKPGTNEVEVIRGPGGEPLRDKPSETEQKQATLANSVAAANKLATELEDKGYKPSMGEKAADKWLPLGLSNYLTSGDYQKYRQTVREFASAWLYGVSGAQITDSEWENANQTFFPQPNEDKGAVELKRQRRAALVEQLQQQTQATGRTGTQAQPTSQGPLKPVGEMSREELLAERDRLRTKR